VELRDGFIVGIFNYCDRWCETCALTSRCRVFADVAEIDAWLDPQLRPLTRGARRQGSSAHAALLATPDAGAVGACEPDSIEDDEQSLDGGRTSMPGDLAELAARAERYREQVRAWLDADPARQRIGADGPLAVIAWFHTMIGAKLAGAFAAAASGVAEEPCQLADSNGRVKAALLGIDRSHAAWLALVEAGMVRMGDASPFVADLVWLGSALESRFPKARAFVRPGFDELEAVAALERA
jgi:hypothetical protein